MNVTGTWERKKGWHRLSLHEELGDGAVARRLAPEGTRWTLYRLGQPIIEARSRTAVIIPEDTEDVETGIGWPRIHVPLDGMSNRIKEPFLAVSGVGTVDRPSLRLLPSDDKWATDLVRTALRKLGKRLAFKVTQNVAVDLDRDGRTDRLVAIEFPANPDPGAIILAMCGRNHGDGQTTVVRETTDELWGLISQASILAVADINDDGLCEIAIEVYAPDLSAYEVFAYNGKRFKRVLAWLQAE